MNFFLLVTLKLGRDNGNPALKDKKSVLHTAPLSTGKMLLKEPIR
jgi:hypothetical protein